MSTPGQIDFPRQSYFKRILYFLCFGFLVLHSLNFPKALACVFAVLISFVLFFHHFIDRVNS